MKKLLILLIPLLLTGCSFLETLDTEPLKDIKYDNPYICKNDFNLRDYTSYTGILHDVNIVYDLNENNNDIKNIYYINTVNFTDANIDERGLKMQIENLTNYCKLINNKESNYKYYSNCEYSILDQVVTYRFKVDPEYIRPKEYVNNLKEYLSSINTLSKLYIKDDVSFSCK